MKLLVEMSGLAEGFKKLAPSEPFQEHLKSSNEIPLQVGVNKWRFSHTSSFQPARACCRARSHFASSSVGPDGDRRLTFSADRAYLTRLEFAEPNVIAEIGVCRTILVLLNPVYRSPAACKERCLK